MVKLPGTKTTNETHRLVVKENFMSKQSSFVGYVRTVPKEIFVAQEFTEGKAELV